MTSYSTSHIFVTLTILLLTCASSFAEEASDYLNGRDKNQVTFRDAGRHRVKLSLSTGDYVCGEVSGDDVTLTLTDSQHRHVRQLASGSGNMSFMFVLNEQGSFQFELTNPPNSEATVTLTRVVARADQKPPAETLASPRLRQLQTTLASGDNTKQFWDEVATQGTPLIESDGVTPPLAKGELLLTFLWRGAKNNVRLFGAPSNDHDEMFHLAGSDVWYRSYRVPDTARVIYRMAPDVPELDASAWQRRRAILATAQRDPLNPKYLPVSAVDKFAGESLVELPNAPDQPWLVKNPEVPAGTIEHCEFASTILGNQRQIVLYRPHDYQPGAESNCLIVLFDGDKYLEQADVATVLDNLIDAKKIPPTAALLITNPSNESRSKELPCNPKFAKFLATELMPWARESGIYATAPRTVVAGASYGGLAAAYVGMQHPEIFGNVYSQSGSFWWSPTPNTDEPEWLTRQYVQADRQPLRFHLETGTMEVGRGSMPGILDTTRHLRDVLQAKRYNVTYREYDSGHGYLYWRFAFPNGVIDLLAAREMD
ncbi:enterochelin esterase [Blastopirellula marina]|uniref:Enterochelin esterase n=1 Tax=Blastopirellula marina TaxID=124 RepID=A0A2S8F2L5_9BACT|nr:MULTISPECIES: enterochelin esterase [Pirellulaceae]PQO26389.1 enterochelin esterase [Blastopirellula marina]RCS44845.1 enterochelin esterase [Bremerella cremea]